MNLKKQKLNIIDELANIENHNPKTKSKEHEEENKQSDKDHDWSSILGVQIESGNQPLS